MPQPPTRLHRRLKIIIIKYHLFHRMPITKPLPKTKAHSIFKNPSINKINTLTPKHTLKTTKPLKIPQALLPVHPYPEKTTFQILVPNEQDVIGSKLDHYEEKEREWRLKEEATEVDIKEEILRGMKEQQCLPEVTELNYEDLCIHLNLVLLEGFKVPKFDVFERIGNHLGHLMAYYDQLVGVERDKVVLMYIFSRSLSREALK